MIILITELIFIFLFPFVSKKNLKIYFFIVALIMSIISFHFDPPTDFDLYRHYENLENFRTYGWDFANSTRIFNSLPVYAIYFYLISLLPLNGFLPGITVFITYYLLFCLIYKISKYCCNVSKIYIMMTFIFVMFATNYVYVVSSIRNLLALSIFSYFLFIDLVEQKNKVICFMVYIMLCLFHSSISVLLAFRILIYLYKKVTKVALKLIFLFWSFFLPIILDNINLFTGQYFNILSQKIETYSAGDRYNLNVLLYNLVLVLIVAITIYIYIKKNKYKNNYSLQYVNYISLIIIFTLGSIKQYDLFIRMAAFIVFSSPYYILMVFSFNGNEELINERISQKRKNIFASNYKKILIVCITLVVMIGVIYQLSSYKQISFKF